MRTRARAERADERRRGAAPGAKNVLEPEAAAIVRETGVGAGRTFALVKTNSSEEKRAVTAMARAIELHASAAPARPSRNSRRTPRRRARSRRRRARGWTRSLPSADDDLPGAVKTRATLRVVKESARGLRETLRALEGARAAVDAARLAHHRGKTHVPGVAAAPSAAGSHEGDVRAFAASLARIVEEAEEDGHVRAAPEAAGHGKVAAGGRS